MNGRAGDREEQIDVRRPRETTALFGHGDAEQVLLEAYRSGRMPHAWLIGGPPGVGKATLAYRLARFVLAHRDPAAPEVSSATSLAVAAENQRGSAVRLGQPGLGLSDLSGLPARRQPNGPPRRRHHG